MIKQNNKPEPFLANPVPEKYIVLTCISIILGIGILDLAGWAFGISILKSFDDHWSPMMIDTAICFVLCGMSLYIIQKKITTGLLSLLPKITGVLVFVVGVITCCLHIAILDNVNEKSIVQNSILGIFLLPNNRMALITGCNFILIGIILYLISFHKKRLTGISQAFIFLPLLINYIIPISYILNISKLHTINNISVALSTAISFCALCLGILFNDTNSWIMKVFTSRSSGGLMARRLLPGMIVLPVVIAWLRIMGERNGLFESAVGVALVAITYTVCFVFLTWLSAKESNKIDNKRKQAEDLQREANEYLENLFSYANAPIIVWDTKSRITRFNPAFELLTGRKAEEVIGNSIEILFPDDHVESSMALIQRAQQGERLEIEEIIILHIDGSIKTVLWNSAPMFSTDGKTITEVIAQGQEITDRKRAENSLRETNEYLENLFNYANAPIIVWDKNSSITRFNPAFELLTGRKAKDVIGHSIEILFPVDRVESSMALIRKAQQGERLEIEEINILHVDGSIKTVLWNSAPIFSADGKAIIEVIAQGQDITERKKVEESIAASEHEFRLLTESMPQIVWTTTADGQNTYFNHQWTDYTGMTLEESYGHGWNKPFHPDDQQRAWDAWQNAIQQNAAYLLQCRLRRSDGVYRWWLIHGVPVIDKNGIITKWYGTCADIDEMKNAGDAILHNEQLLLSVIENVNSGVALIDETGKFVVYNPVFLKIFGLSPDSTIKNVNNQDWSQWQIFDENKNLLHVDDHPVRKAAMDGKQVKNQLVAMKLPSSDEYIWLLVSAQPLQKVDGSIDKIICTYLDITDRKQAEEQIKKSEERFLTMANAIPQLAWIAHADGFIFWYNQRWYEYTGTTPEQMEGWGWQRVHDPSVLQAVLEKWQFSIATGESFDMEFPLLGADGKFRNFLTRVMPLKDSTGRILQWFGTNTDITELKQAETALKLLSSELEIIIDSIPGLVFYKDVNNHYLRVNKYMCDAYGKSKKQLEGIDLNELHTNEQAKAYYNADLKVIKSRTPELNIDEPWETEMGLRWVNTSKVPYMDQNGEVVGVIGVSMDVTERRQADKELEVYRKHLEELVTERTTDLAVAIHNLERSNKELEEFAYVASHDLQEPLRMVSSYTQLLERRYKDKLDQDANDFIQYAVDGASRMQKLINDLLDFSRVSSQGREFTKVDISQVLGHAISNLQNLISDNLALVTNEELPVINIDESQIVQVFQNLIENGIKYKKKTEMPKIHIACKKKNNLYEFSVSDNGIGIDMQYHDRIFIIFQRLHKKDEFPGTGIGLSVTKRIVERHGGTIWFESKKEVGTTFHFTIPA